MSQNRQDKIKTPVRNVAPPLKSPRRMPPPQSVGAKFGKPGTTNPSGGPELRMKSPLLN